MAKRKRELLFRFQVFRVFLPDSTNSKQAYRTAWPYVVSAHRRRMLHKVGEVGVAKSRSVGLACQRLGQAATLPTSTTRRDMDWFAAPLWSVGITSLIRSQNSFG